VTTAVSRFYNVILCEDIRDEVGNKKSLMGVMTGDVVVGSFPVVLSVAIFMEYRPNAVDPVRVSFNFRLLQDEVEVVKAGMVSDIPAGQSANLIMPRALMSVEKEVIFRILGSVDGGPEEEVLKKRIFVQSTTS